MLYYIESYGWNSFRVIEEVWFPRWREMQKNDIQQGISNKIKYLDELLAQVDLLKEENNLIVTNTNMVDHLYLNVEAERLFTFHFMVRGELKVKQWKF